MVERIENTTNEYQNDRINKAPDRCIAPRQRFCCLLYVLSKYFEVVNTDDVIVLFSSLRVLPSCEIMHNVIHYEGVAIVYFYSTIHPLSTVSVSCSFNIKQNHCTLLPVLCFVCKKVIEHYVCVW